MALEHLPTELEANILEAVNDNEARMEADLLIIEGWIRCQPHLPFGTYDKRILKAFLRGCKHNMEKVKSKLNMYFTCRTIYSEIFQNRNPLDPLIQQALQNFHVVPLPKPTVDGYRLVFHQSTSDASQFDPAAVFKVIYMIADIRLVEEPPIIGDIFIFDVEKMTTGHFTKIVTPLLKYALHSAQEAYPQRLKEIHLLHFSPIVDRVIKFFKTFLNEKMRNRFYIHTSADTLLNHVPRSHLPEDYGGQLKPLCELQQLWIDKLESYKEYFLEQDSIKSDESKRSGRKPYIRDDMAFSTEGTFRQLQID